MGTSRLRRGHRFRTLAHVSARKESAGPRDRAYESVFSGDQATLLDKYDAEDRYVGSLVGVRYAEAFRARSPLLVESPDVFLKSRFG